MNRKVAGWRERLLSLAPFCIWVSVIFLLSSGVGSSTETSRVIRPLLEWLFPAADALTIDTYHLYVRKAAHFTEYFILGTLAWRAFATFRRKIATALTALSVVVVVALADEFNQSFNPARTSSIWDSGLDVLGGTTAILILLVMTQRFNRGRHE